MTAANTGRFTDTSEISTAFSPRSCGIWFVLPPPGPGFSTGEPSRTLLVPSVITVSPARRRLGDDDIPRYSATQRDCSFFGDAVRDDENVLIGAFRNDCLFRRNQCTCLGLAAGRPS